MKKQLVMMFNKRAFVVLLLFCISLVGYSQFPVDGKIFFFRDADGSLFGPTYLSSFEGYTTGAPTITNHCLMNMPQSVKHNALGANNKDGYLYYVQTDSGATTSKVYRLDQNCTSTYMFTLPFTTISACFDNKGRYWVVSQIFPHRLYAYDVSTGTLVKGPFNLNASGIKDISYNIYDCHFYCGEHSSIKKIDTAGAVVATYIPGFLLNEQYGGTAIGIDGKLYGMTNSLTASSICSFNTTLGTSDSLTTFSPGPPNNASGPGTGSDMASFAVYDSIKTNCKISHQTYCTLPANVTFRDSTNGMVNSWEWDFGDGNTSTLQHPVHSYTSAGTYTVRLIGKNTQPFCIPIIPDTTYLTVTILPGITLASSISNVSCNGLSNGSITVQASNGGAPYSYSWSNGETSNIASNLNAGLYNVIVTDNLGCTATWSFNITQPLPLQLTTSQGTSICSGNTVIISANATGGSGNINYLWSNGSVVATQNVSPQTTTTYSITATDNCETITLELEIAVYNSPIVTIEASDSSGCAPLCIQLSAQTTSIINDYQWNLGDGSNSSQNSPYHCFTSPGSYDITLLVTDKNGCTASITNEKMIRVFPQATAAFSSSSIHEMIYKNISFTNFSTNASNWLWDFGNGTTSNSQHPTYSYDSPGNFTVKLIATNEFGCNDSTFENITIVPELTFYAPNAFTPNNDGRNDLFSPQGTGFKLDSYKLMIFDRWGNLIFETTDYQKGWNGNVNETPAQIDTYVWEVEYRDLLDIKHIHVGAINLIK